MKPERTSRVLGGTWVVLIAVGLCPLVCGKFITVDDEGQADFRRIQAGIDAAGYGDIVLVAPGTYFENVTLRDGVSLIGSGPEVTVIDANGHGDVVDARADGAAVAGFTLRNSGQSGSPHLNCGIYVEGDHAPVIKGNVIVGNRAGVGVWYGAHPDVRNNVIENNGDGLYLYGSMAEPSDPNIINNTIVYNQDDGILLREWVSPTIANNIVVGHVSGINRNYVKGTPILSYNNLWDNDVNHLHDGAPDDSLAGRGSVSVNPRFARGGYWADANDPNLAVTGPDGGNAVWMPGDYHLKSQAGRYDPDGQAWVSDLVSSPCIDAGDPEGPVGFEPRPNGGILNLGAYGGTSKASKSPSHRHGRYGGGRGDPNRPYLIYTADQMDALCAELNDWDRHFRLMADIDLAGRSYDRALIAPDTDPCDPAFTGTAFTGVLDGNGHAISNMTIQGTSYLGLFGRTASGSVVEGVRLEQASVEGTDYVGAVAGFHEGRMAASCATGTVRGDSRVGGLTGRNWGSVTTAYSAAAVTGVDDVGGLAGGNYGSITDSYNTGSVGADRDAGGIACDNYGTITNCYSTGRITGTTQVGGIAGSSSADAAVTACFWDTQISGQETSAGGTGKTTAEMQTAKTFLDVGWDFAGETANGTEDLWWIDEGQDYPRLSWEAVQSASMTVGP
ncbi:MAG: right-handed parallel beta-helix repeat-containing protein [Phycisphaerae bacterium]|nr:right-handed parallel beta-helix repeat-containing protein [Phycisphaerae bacterium]